MLGNVEINLKTYQIMKQKMMKHWKIQAKKENLKWMH